MGAFTPEQEARIETIVKGALVAIMEVNRKTTETALRKPILELENNVKQTVAANESLSGKVEALRDDIFTYDRGLRHTVEALVPLLVKKGIVDLDHLREDIKQSEARDAVNKLFPPEPGSKEQPS